MTSITEVNIKNVDVPEDFICPISQILMEDPVIADDGFTYERKAIAKWFNIKKTSPMTNEPIGDERLVPNRTIKSQIIKFKEENKLIIIND